MPKLSQNERLARLVAETRGKDRFQDLAMVFRRPMCVFTVPVRAEQIVIAAGVQLRVLSDAQAGIPVAVTSEIIGASAQVPAGAEVSGLARPSVGRYVPELILRAGGIWDHFLHGWVMDGAERRAASPQRLQHVGRVGLTPAGRLFDLDQRDVDVGRGGRAAREQLDRRDRPRRHRPRAG